MNLFVEILNKLALLVPILLAVGAGWKYLPVVKKAINEGVIPILNALVAFFVGFGGGTAVAHAGIFGDIGRAMSVPAQAMASILISYLTSLLHDKLMKPLTPPSPYRG